MALSEIDMTKVKYFDLNNEINIPKDGQKIGRAHV